MSKRVKIIQPKTQKEDIRLAAYCRVSTSKGDQLESLEQQITYYSSYADSHPEYKLVGVYYDEGVSGRSREKRQGLKQMLSDCHNHKIDVVITKSISRLCRNTVDCIEIVRTLRDLDIAVIFEKENINTGSMEGELMLSIMSSMAQDESQSISNNVRWGIKQRFRQGIFKLSNPSYGYVLDNGNPVISDEEAEVVRLIFRLALEGKGIHLIIKELNKRGIKPRKGGEWKKGTLFGILHNESYTGDMLFQKTFTQGTMKKKNTGQEDQYLVSNHHEPIISHEDFNKVQELLTERSKKHHTDHIVKRISPFSGMMRCGCCGAPMIRSRQYYTVNDKHIYFRSWYCSGRRNNNECSLRDIREKDVEHAFVVMMQKLVKYKLYTIRPLYDLANNYVSVNFEVVDARNTVFRKIDNVYISYEQKTALNDLWSILDSQKTYQEFNENDCYTVVEKIIVYSGYDIEFQLKCGLNLREAIN